MKKFPALKESVNYSFWWEILYIFIEGKKHMNIFS